MNDASKVSKYMAEAIHYEQKAQALAAENESLKASLEAAAYAAEEDLNCTGDQLWLTCPEAQLPPEQYCGVCHLRTILGNYALKASLTLLTNAALDVIVYGKPSVLAPAMYLVRRTSLESMREALLKVQAIVTQPKPAPVDET